MIVLPSAFYYSFLFYFIGKYQAQVAIYCGSIPKLKSGCKSSRGGSIDSTLQLHGNGWMTTHEGEDPTLGMIGSLDMGVVVTPINRLNET